MSVSWRMGAFISSPHRDSKKGSQIPASQTVQRTGASRLGMGVKAGFRRKGIGKGLLKAALNQAFGQGLERVEIEVFRSNDSAVRLYEAHGFLREGVKVGARKLDGMSDDILLFAAFKNA